jgi:hypothetical protein
MVLSFTVCNEGRNRGSAKKCVQIATADSSLYCLWRRVMVPIQSTAPTARMLTGFPLEGPGQTALRCMICLRYTVEKMLMI